MVGTDEAVISRVEARRMVVVVWVFSFFVVLLCWSGSGLL